jgi:hypothetical protein
MHVSRATEVGKRRRRSHELCLVAIRKAARQTATLAGVLKAEETKRDDQGRAVVWWARVFFSPAFVWGVSGVDTMSSSPGAF